MATVIIAALVAASVSLLGLLVQIKIARISQRTVREEPLRELEKEELLAMSSGLRSLERETEVLRICSWRLLGSFNSQETGEKEGLGKERKEFLGACDELLKQERVFLEAWANVKSSVPSGLVSYVRFIRHECRNRLDVIHNTLDVLARVGPSSRPDIVFNLFQEVRSLLEDLDEFSRVTRQVRLLPIGQERSTILKPNYGVSETKAPNTGPQADA